ncbi:hypothetical protein KKG90_05140 [Candidatus Bipolaricaulota bacterium]|nr:hypothetical protein [Candidatus Bipolaricaulota bacterium]
MIERFVGNLYEKYYAGDKARRGLFDALAAWRTWERVLYPGSFIHVTASFLFPSVIYVDNDRNAQRFFSQMDEVRAFVEKNKVYEESPQLTFYGTSYESSLDEPERSCDLLLSLYAGFISKPCKRYLKIGGILAVNNSHGDAGLASIDSDYLFISSVQRRGDQLRVVQDNLDAYFKPKKKTDVTEELLRRLGRGVAYTKTAPLYLFERVR